MLELAERPTSRYVRVTARALARETIWWACCRHAKPARRGILLFATRRGGSTWAMELIGANRGIRPLNQPLETLSRNLTLSQALELPRFAEGQITSLDDRQAKAVAGFVEQLLHGELVVNAPTRFWQRDFTWAADRALLKITDAKAVMGWFSKHIDADVVYFTRHPVAQSLSCIRNAWTLTTDAYLRDETFMSTFLSDEGDYCRYLASHGSMLEQWVLNWAVENVAPLRQLSERTEWLHVRYEDTVLRPQEELERLATHLDLPDVDRMRARLRRPSGSSSRSLRETRGAIAAGDSAELLDRWRASIDKADLRACAWVLERLRIDPSTVVTVW